MDDFRKRLFAMTVLAVILSSALAEARQADVAVGYIKLHGTMRGVNVELSAPTRRHWTLVAELDATRGKDRPDDGAEYRDVAGLGGVRFTWQPTPRVSPFWQILAGGLHSKADDYYVEYCCGLGRRLQQGYTINYFALQPGGGLTMMITRHVGFRVQADVQFAIPDQSKWDGISIFPRVVTGAVVRLGR